MEYLNLIINPITTFALIGLIIFCILLLMLFRKSLYKWLLWFYIVTMTVSLIFISLSLLSKTLISLILKEEVTGYAALINPFIDNIAKSLLIYSIVLFALSIIAFVLHYILKKKKSGKKEVQLEEPIGL
ncbi:MAG: hypothetical protein IJB71_01485 [Bacilli bacterium]|nr:hypothetical protein [Bacilli bacterium]